MFGDADEVDATIDAGRPSSAPPPVVLRRRAHVLADAAGVCAFLNLPAGAAGAATSSRRRTSSASFAREP